MRISAAELTAFITAVTSLVTAVTALVHSMRTRAVIVKAARLTLERAEKEAGG